MRLFYRKQTDPYFNLAAEEYLLKTATEDLLVFWKNEPCIVIGKHQNPFAETNSQFLKDNNIPLIRRISGGGAVYHDLGNINFTFIHFFDNENKVDFNRFLQPIALILQEMGVDVEIGKRHDLLVNKLKFSGNAEHVYKNKVLHHGTLLFNSNLENLKNALSAKSKNYLSVAVKSVRSSVTNITNFLPEVISSEKFIQIILEKFNKYFSISNSGGLTENELESINQLVAEKYKTWEWNYGYTPTFSFTANIENYEFEISIKNGVIYKCIAINKPINPFEKLICDFLIGCNYNEDKIIEKWQMNTDNIKKEIYSHKILINSLF